MADVAEVAGVSHQTVSRVLNGKDHVRPETRTRVVAALEQLQYRRNQAARALVTRRSQLLGVVASGTSFYGPANMLQSIEAAARAAGYFVTVANLATITPETVADAIGVFEELGTDGVVIIAPHEAAIDVLRSIGDDLPAVVVEGDLETSTMPVVCIDQEEVGRLATGHLLGLGHATVHHLAGPREWLEAQGRERGWRRCLAAAGAVIPEPQHGDWTARSGYEIGLRLACEEDLTALFVANDQMALGVLRAFGERGIRVPEDVSVVGVDDVPEAEYFSPPLTTVAQDFHAVGRRSLQVLLDLLDGVDVADRHALAPLLRHRSSTAPTGPHRKPRGK